MHRIFAAPSVPEFGKILAGLGVTATGSKPSALMSSGGQMNVTYAEKAKQWPEGLLLIQKATEQLEDVLGSSASLVSAVWDRTEDSKGRTLYSLRISDFGKCKRDSSA